MRIVLWCIFWFLYFPLLRILDLLLFWNTKVIERNRFEKKNKFEFLAHSFREKNIVADLCFEFSSEGEFQQVAPLIEDALGAGKKIELVFFSPSVEKAIMKLASSYPQQIRYLRFPLIRLLPFVQRRSFTHWVTAKTLIMVRYDLFPELLLWSMKDGNTLKFVWMTFKKERSKGSTPSLWKKAFLKASSLIVYAGEEDAKEGLALGFPGHTYDLRIEQIRRRVEKKEEKFSQVFKIYPDFKKHIQTFPKSLILGNAWPSDLFLLRDLPRDVLLVIVPHQLSPEILNLFREGLDALQREMFEINDGTTELRPSSTYLINKKGILCELYGDFTHAYVGGGFEGSIHSVLEPLISGNSHLSCGPFHHRSTEYDVARDWNRITEVNTPEQFHQWINNARKKESHDRMNAIKDGYREVRERVISC